MRWWCVPECTPQAVPVGRSTRRPRSVLACLGGVRHTNGWPAGGTAGRIKQRSLRYCDANTSRGHGRTAAIRSLNLDGNRVFVLPCRIIAARRPSGLAECDCQRALRQAVFWQYTILSTGMSPSSIPRFRSRSDRPRRKGRQNTPTCGARCRARSSCPCGYRKHWRSSSGAMSRTASLSVSSSGSPSIAGGGLNIDVGRGLTINAC